MHSTPWRGPVKGDSPMRERLQAAREVVQLATLLLLDVTSLVAVAALLAKLLV